MNHYNFIFVYVTIFMQFMLFISQSTSTTTTSTIANQETNILPAIPNYILYIIIGCASFIIVIILCIAIICCYWNKQNRKADESLVALQNVTTVSNTSERGKNDSEKNATDTTNNQKYVSPSVNVNITDNKTTTIQSKHSENIPKQSDNISTTKPSETTETVAETNGKQTLNIPTTSTKPRSSGITRSFLSFLNYVNKDAAVVKTTKTPTNNNVNHPQQRQNNMVVNMHNAQQNAVMYQNMYLQRQPMTQSAPHFNMQPPSPQSPNQTLQNNNQFPASQKQTIAQSTPNFNMSQVPQSHSPYSSNNIRQQMQNMYAQRQIMCNSVPNFYMQQQNSQPQMQTNVYNQVKMIPNSAPNLKQTVAVNNAYGQQIQSVPQHGMIPEEKDDDTSVHNDTDSFDVETDEEENSEENDSGSEESQTDGDQSEDSSNGTVNIVDLNENSNDTVNIVDVNENSNDTMNS